MRHPPVVLAPVLLALLSLGSACGGVETEEFDSLIEAIEDAQLV